MTCSASISTCGATYAWDSERICDSGCNFRGGFDAGCIKEGTEMAVGMCLVFIMTVGQTGKEGLLKDKRHERCGGWKGLKLRVKCLWAP